MRKVGALALVATAAMTLAVPSFAGGSVWRRVAEASAADDEALLARARRLHARYYALKNVDEKQAKETLLTEHHLLERGGASTSSVTALRHALARVEQALYSVDADDAHLRKAIDLLEPIVANESRASSTLRASASFELAVCHAHRRQRREELASYRQALAMEPDPLHRSLVLANAADARMGLGDVDAALAVFSEALSLLPGILLPTNGITTLWGYAVALDRAGDLPQAVEQIALARAFDPTDAELRSPNWFFVPPREAHWYAALGHWASARAATDDSTRRASLTAAIENYEAYMADAPSDDRWRSLAEHRIALCKRELRRRALAAASSRSR